MSAVAEIPCSTTELHRRIVAVATEYRQAEHTLAALLARMADGARYRELGYTSVGDYGARALDLTPRQARALARLGKVGPEFPAVDEAFREGRLSWTKARELLRVVTTENQAAWVARAEQVTSRELERQIACTTGDKGPPDPEAVRGEPRVRVVFDMSAQEADQLRAVLALAGDVEGVLGLGGVGGHELAAGVLLGDDEALGVVAEGAAVHEVGERDEEVEGGAGVGGARGDAGVVAEGGAVGAGVVRVASAGADFEGAGGALSPPMPSMST